MHVFHDGIIMTHEESIVYSNNQTRQILEVKENLSDARLIQTVKGLVPQEADGPGENLWDQIKGVEESDSPYKCSTNSDINGEYYKQ